MKYVNSDWVIGVLLYNEPQLLEEIIYDCIKTVYSWGKEIHDLKEITADVLSRYESRLNAVMYHKCKQMRIPIGGSNPWEYCFPGPGRDRTRMYKYFLSYIFRHIYWEDKRFKYYTKYNGGTDKAARHKRLGIYKDSKFSNVKRENPDSNYLLNQCILLLNVRYQLWQMQNR